MHSHYNRLGKLSPIVFVSTGGRSFAVRRFVETGASNDFDFHNLIFNGLLNYYRPTKCQSIKLLKVNEIVKFSDAIFHCN